VRFLKALAIAVAVLSVTACTPAQKAAFTRWAHARARVLAVYDPLQCGGDLPPCYVMERESGGDPTAENPISTASGKWQALDTTWNHWGGYSHASFAPVDVQDAFARWLWDGGRGCSHWEAC
jgi:hypothetical protein